MDPKLISFDQAQQIILQEVSSLNKRAPLQTESVGLLQSLDRTAAQDIYAEENLPNVDNSAMDGFAVRSKDCQSASDVHKVRLPIQGTLAAGDNYRSRITANEREQPQAWEIMTGASFPEGFDSCLRVEDAIVVHDANTGQQFLEIKKPIMAGTNLRLQGEDFSPGKVILKKGQRIRAEDILSLASLGVLSISVFRKLKVGLFATGKELVDIRQKPEPGQIRNSSASFLQAALLTRNVELQILGVIHDDVEEFRQGLKKALTENFDLLMTTGAISMGKFDFVVDEIQKSDAKIHFQKIQMRPGRPIVFAEFPQNTFYFGLPGNPVSTAVGLRFFVDHFLRLRLHESAEIPLPMRLSAPVKKTPGVNSFLKGSVTWDPDSQQLRLTAHPGQQPSLIHPLQESNVWIQLKDDSQTGKVGDRVFVYPLDPRGALVPRV
jgi:molybdopterin molybdotransferase